MLLPNGLGLKVWLNFFPLPQIVHLGSKCCRVEIMWIEGKEMKEEMLC